MKLFSKIYEEMQKKKNNFVLSEGHISINYDVPSYYRIGIHTRDPNTMKEIQKEIANGYGFDHESSEHIKKLGDKYERGIFYLLRYRCVENTNDRGETVRKHVPIDETMYRYNVVSLHPYMQTDIDLDHLDDPDSLEGKRYKNMWGLKKTDQDLPRHPKS